MTKPVTFGPMVANGLEGMLREYCGPPTRPKGSREPLDA